MKKYREGLVDNAGALDWFAGIVENFNFDYDDQEADNLQVTREALMKLAKEVIELEGEHEKLGLSRAEMAFYHAVNRPENVQDFYTDD